MTIRNMFTLVAASLLAALAAASSAVAQEGGEGTLKWSFKAGNWVDAPAIATDGTIYAGVRGKGLHAFSPDGKLKWVFRAGDGSVLRGLLAPGIRDLVGYSLLAIASDRTIYVDSGDTIYALSADGKRKWTFAGSGQFSTAALGADGTIYVTSRNNALYALAPDGKLRWSYNMQRGRFSAGPAAPAVGADGTIYAGDFGNHLHALTREGKPKWTVRVHEEGRIVGLALAADGTVYVASGPQEPSRRTAIFAFTPEGRQLWTYVMSERVPFDPLVPLVGPDGTIYTGLFDLIALTPEGMRKWRFKAEGNIRASPRISANSTIYLATNKLYAVSPQGTLIWSSKPLMGPLVESPPAIGADGTVYVGTHGEYGRPEEGALFAFRSSSRDRPAAAIPSSTPSARVDGPQAKAREALGKQGIPFAPERLLECVEVGDITCVNHFLAAGMSPDAQDERGTNALMRALYGRRIEIAGVLIEKGADVNARSKSGESVLWAAAHAGRLEFVALLLAKGANPNIQDTSGDTALMRAAYRGDARMADALLEKDADPNLQANNGGTPLIGAAEWGHIEVIKLLLAKGANPNAQRKDVWWTATALMSASYNGHVPVVKLLLENGADHNLRDKSGRTALMVASSKGHVEVVTSLLGKGADINARDDDGKTALAFAKAHTDRRNRAAVIAVLDAAAKKK